MRRNEESYSLGHSKFIIYIGGRMKPEPLTKEKIRTHLEQDEEGRWVIHISGIRTIDVKSAVQWLLEEIEREASGDLPNPSFQTKLEKASYWLGFTDGYNHAKKWIIDLIRKAFSGAIE